MKKNVYSDEQIVNLLRETEKTDLTVAEFCRAKGISEGTYYKWKNRFGQMQVAEVRRLRELETENAKLKRLLADRLVEIDAMQELLAKKWWAARAQARGRHDAENQADFRTPLVSTRVFLALDLPLQIAARGRHRI